MNSGRAERSNRNLDQRGKQPTCSTASIEVTQDETATRLALVAAQEEKHMTTESISTLVPSTNSGRYALDDPISGPDVTSGQPLAVLLGG